MTENQDYGIFHRAGHVSSGSACLYAIALARPQGAESIPSKPSLGSLLHHAEDWDLE